MIWGWFSLGAMGVVEIEELKSRCGESLAHCEVDLL